MSIKIGKWLKGIWTGIKKLFGKLKKEIKELIPVAVFVVQQIKVVMDSPVPDVISSLIPGEADDKVKDKLREWLPKLILQLGMIEAIANIEDPNEQLNAILAKIKLSSDDAKNVFFHGLASLIIEKLADGHLSWSDSVVISEYYYRNMVKEEVEG